MKKLTVILMILVFALIPFATDHLLITEVSVSSSSGINAEFIEIYNPTDTEIDLTNYYLTDATYAGGSVYYYKIVEGDGGGGGYGDFNAKFPDGATIKPGQYIVVAMNGADFISKYNYTPDYELYDTDASIPDMQEATSGSINNQGSLTDSGEVVILYYWDGQSDLVQDVDYFVWGDKVEAVDKTGVSEDGPDADTATTTYKDDTSIDSQIAQIDISGDDRFFTFQRVDLDESTETKDGNGNGITGDDETSEDLTKAFTLALATPGAAYDSEKNKTSNYIGYAELPNSYKEVSDVTFSLYPAGTTLDEILFGQVDPIGTQVSTPNNKNIRINIDFNGLTEGASYVLTGFGNNYVFSAYGELTRNVYTGNHDYLYLYDQVKDTTANHFYAIGSGETVTATITWDNYSDSDTGKIADSYDVHVYDYTDVTEYTTTDTTLDIVLNEGEEVQYVILASTGGQLISRSPVAKLYAGVAITLDDVQVLAINKIELTFSGNLNSATSASDFTVNPSLTIANIEVNNNIVDITFSQDIAKDVNYTITANVTDEHGMPIDSAHNSATFVRTVVYPEVTKAEMINNQTVKVYFNKDMMLNPDTFGYVKDSFLYFVHAADWSNYHFVNMVEYNIEEKSATLHLDSIMTMNTDYVVECDGIYTYGGGYVMDADGYTVDQSGKYYANFKTTLNNLDLVYSYPSPAVYGGSITFTNLIGKGTISIYTINGVKIKDVDFDDVEQTVELKTLSGKNLNSGIYFYRIKSDKGTKTGSFAILKKSVTVD